MALDTDITIAYHTVHYNVDEMDDDDSGTEPSEQADFEEDESAHSAVSEEDSESAEERAEEQEDDWTMDTLDSNNIASDSFRLPPPARSLADGSIINAVTADIAGPITRGTSADPPVNAYRMQYDPINRTVRFYVTGPDQTPGKTRSIERSRTSSRTISSMSTSPIITTRWTAATPLPGQRHFLSTSPATLSTKTPWSLKVSAK